MSLSFFACTGKFPGQGKVSLYVLKCIAYNNSMDGVVIFTIESVFRGVCVWCGEGGGER